MSTQDHAKDGDGPSPADSAVDDSNPTGNYRSSAAEQVQQTVADHEEPVASPEDPITVAEDPVAATPLEPSERYAWMKDTRQWGVRAPVTAHGLTIEAINIGVYGEIPDESREMTRMPRGSFATPGLPRLDNYSVNRKEELWSENAPALYEEAIQRRWVAMQDIPWDELSPMPQALELAWCQLCTELGHYAIAETDTIGQWLHRMNYAYIEPKMFLATQEFDAGRHSEVMRHRALSNGGTLGLESPGMLSRRMMETRAGWPETAVPLYMARGLLTMLLYRFGAHYAMNPADRKIFSLGLQDKARHLAYGQGFLKFSVALQGADFATSLRRTLGSIEKDMAGEMKDPVLWEAMAIIAGGSVSEMKNGMVAVRRLRADYIRQYVARLRYVGIGKQENALHPELLEVMQGP